MFFSTVPISVARASFKRVLNMAHAQSIAEKRPLMTVEEFLDWDGGGHIGKLELVNGQIRAMAPASATHHMIQGNIFAAIHAHLKRSEGPCSAAPEASIVPRFDSRHNTRAPDISVTCEPVTAAKLFPDPVIIVEVLSPSNEKQTWEAINACATIPALREILVIHSERVHARIYRRDETGAWPKTGIRVKAGEMVELREIGLHFPLNQAYSKTHLA